MTTTFQKRKCSAEIRFQRSIRLGRRHAQMIFGTDAFWLRRKRMERLFMWMAIVGVIGIALTLTWMLFTRTM